MHVLRYQASKFPITQTRAPSSQHSTKPSAHCTAQHSRNTGDIITKLARLKKYWGCGGTPDYWDKTNNCLACPNTYKSGVKEHTDEARKQHKAHRKAWNNKKHKNRRDGNGGILLESARHRCTCQQSTCARETTRFMQPSIRGWTS